MNIWKLSIMVALGVFAGACGGGGSGGGDSALTISVTPTTPSLTVGQSLQLQATIRDSSGQLVGGKTVAWSSASTTVLTISASGMATAVGEGSARAIATVENRQGSTTVTVGLPAPVPVSRVTVTPASAVVVEGQSRAFTATVFDADGNELTGRGVAWTTEDAGIALVDAAGLVTGIRVGATSIGVRVEGVAAAASVTVEATYDHELVFSRSVVPGGQELAVLDLADPAAVALPVFTDGTLAYDPVASPDGTRLVFVVGNAAGGAIYTANRDGTGLRPLADDAAGNDQPSWSPDGAQIAFRRREAGKDSDIWVMNGSTGDGRTNLTADLGATNQNSPAWSPVLMGGGTQIAFSHSDSGAGHIWTMNPDGSGKFPVTSSPTAYDDEPAWSPDGAQIVFQRSDSAIFGDLYVVSSAGGNGGLLMRFIGPLPGPQFAPAWSPDGNLIAFTSRHESDTYQLYTVWLDGTRVARRTFDDATYAFPAWIRRPRG